jgi:hypothetical protein
MATAIGILRGSQHRRTTNAQASLHYGKNDSKGGCPGGLSAAGIGVIGASRPREQSFGPLHQYPRRGFLCDFSGQDGFDVEAATSPSAVDVCMAVLMYVVHVGGPKPDPPPNSRSILQAMYVMVANGWGGYSRCLKINSVMS